jgi:hypothetical protein
MADKFIEVEETVIQVILGELLFLDLKKIVNKTYTGTNVHYPKLLEWTKKIFANLSFAKAVPNLNLTVNRNGILTYSNSSSLSSKVNNPASEIAIMRMQEDANNLAKAYRQMLEKYLLDNYLEIPLFQMPTTTQGPLKNLDEWGFHAAM